MKVGLDEFFNVVPFTILDYIGYIRHNTENLSLFSINHIREITQNTSLKYFRKKQPIKKIEE